MASVRFALLPEKLLRVHEVLICLSKFNESVCIEAEYDFLRFSVLNPTKSGYASFKFDSDSFFSEYSFTPKRTATGSTAADKFSCQIYLKALLSVFKGRANDHKDKETAIERCVAEVFDGPDEAECRLVIQMICRHGVVKTYKLTYEAVEVQHALFDRSKTQNQWKIESKFLREIIDHFGPAAEQLDIHSENSHSQNGKAVFTSFTQKVSNGKEILKHPVHTAVTIDTRDFDHFFVEENLHVAISVRDFKAIVSHADTLKTAITARYTRPCRPLQLSYELNGMACAFTLMTRGEAGEGAGATPTNGADARELSARPSSRPPQQNASVSHDANTAPPETGPNTAGDRAPLQQTQPVVQESGENARQQISESADPLFVPADDDRQWDEPLFGDEEEDMLGWDAHTDQDAQRVSLGASIQDNIPKAAVPESERESETALPPTQRISQIRGLFD